MGAPAALKNVECVGAKEQEAIDVEMGEEEGENGLNREELDAAFAQAAPAVGAANEGAAGGVFAAPPLSGGIRRADYVR